MSEPIIPIVNENDTTVSMNDNYSVECRMYEQKYPEVDDLVVVEVKSIEEMGAYVALKEYNDIEGMILLSELSRRRIRSINKIIRVGRLETVVVLRVDKKKDISTYLREESPKKILQNVRRNTTNPKRFTVLCDILQKLLTMIWNNFIHKLVGHYTRNMDMPMMLLNPLSMNQIKFLKDLI